MAKPVDGPDRFTTNVLDVHFIWPHPGPAWRAVEPGILEPYNAVLRVARPAMVRQKRDRVCYWDAMTALDRGEAFPRRHPESQTWGLATELSVAIRDGKLDRRPLLELGGMERVNQVRTRIEWRREGDTTSARHAIDVSVDLHGRRRSSKLGVYRRFELEMPDQHGDMSSVDWFDVMLLAVVVHLKADIEQYLESNFLPLRVCARRACGSFFRVHRMAGRHQFCSDTCRACAAREQ